MSATNDEEISEMNETLLKNEDGEEERVEETTEMETEPVEVVENNDAVNETVEETMEEEAPVVEETEQPQQEEQSIVVEETAPPDKMNVDKPEVVPVEEIQPIETKPVESEKNNNLGTVNKSLTEPAGINMYNGPIYCIEQVRIPPELPEIMKNYAKHIIRTQPEDVLVESYEYFKRLNKLRNSIDEYDDDGIKSAKSYAKSNEPTDLDNLSINSDNQENEENKEKKSIQLSPLEFESLYERLLDYSNEGDTINVSDIRSIAEDANIAENEINEALIVGSWDNDVEWIKFWALIVAGSCSSLSSTLKVILNIIGDENIIPLKKATTIIKFLLENDPNSKKEVVDDIISKLNEKTDSVIEKGDLTDILSEIL